MDEDKTEQTSEECERECRCKRRDCAKTSKKRRTKNEEQKVEFEFLNIKLIRFALQNNRKS